MNNWDCRASKILWNDTKAEPISWEINIENSIFNFCVGVWVGEYPRQIFHIDEKMPKEIPHLLTCMKFPLLNCSKIPFHEGWKCMGCIPWEMGKSLISSTTVRFTESVPIPWNKNRSQKSYAKKLSRNSLYFFCIFYFFKSLF